MGTGAEARVGTGAEAILKPEGQERSLKSLLWAEERVLGKPRRLPGRVEKQE